MSIDIFLHANAYIQGWLRKKRFIKEDKLKELVWKTRMDKGDAMWAVAERLKNVEHIYIPFSKKEIFLMKAKRLFRTLTRKSRIKNPLSFLRR